MARGKTRRNLSRETRALLNKANDSFVLAVELFNRPQEHARNHSVVLLLAHSFEMLLKAGILARGGNIRTSSGERTHTMSKCISIAFSSEGIAFLERAEEEVLRAVSIVRNQEQHHFAEITERALSILMAWSTDTYGKILRRVFDRDLGSVLPLRSAPDFAVSPETLVRLLNDDVLDAKSLFRDHPRSISIISAKLRGWASINAALDGSDSDVKIREAQIRQTFDELIRKSTDAPAIFAALERAPDVTRGSSISLELRFGTDTGADAALRVVPAAADDPEAVHIRPDRFPDEHVLSPQDVYNHLGITNPKMRALGQFLGFDYENGDIYVHVIKGGKVPLLRYSALAQETLEQGLRDHDLDDVWAWHRGKLPGKEKVRRRSATKATDEMSDSN